MLARSHFETSDTAASSAEVGWATAACLSLGALTILLAPYANISVSPRLLDAFAVALVLVSTFTMLLLLWRARLTRAAGDAALAAAFVYATVTVSAYALALVSHPRAASTNWFWFVWVLALPAGTIFYARGDILKRDGADRFYWIALGAAALALVLAYTLEHQAFAPALEGALRTVRLVVAFAVNALALGVLARGRGLGGSLHLWLAVALGARLLNIYLYFGSHGETTIRDLFPHIVTLGVTMILFVAFVSDFARIIQRSQSLETAFEREHQMLKGLQSAFLPPYLPQMDGVLFNASYKPASGEAGLGGDWYDVFVAHEENVVLSVGDINGHGWNAASAMVRLRETVRAASLLRDSSPADILSVAHEMFYRSQPETMASVLVGIYDIAARRFRYASAGHPPPVLLKNGIARSGEYGGIPFGVQRRAEYETYEVTLDTGDAVGFYSDGVIESGRDVADGERRLLEAFSRSRYDARAIIREVAGDHPADDAVLLIMSPTATASQRAAWHFRSDDAMDAQIARHSFLQYLARNRFSASAIENAEIAFGELVGNVVRHAPGPIEIDLWWHHERPLLTVRDRGPGFSPQPSTFDLPPDPLAETGRGLFLVCASETTPDVQLRTGGGTEVSVEMRTI